MANPLRYGDTLCLFSRTVYHGREDTPAKARGGYVGVYTKHNLVAIDPAPADRFRVQRFTVLPSPLNRDALVGGPVLYGDVLLLVDERKQTWNIKTNTWFDIYLACKQRGMPGEIHVGLVHPTKKKGQQVCFEDKQVSMDIKYTHASDDRSKYNNRLTVSKKKSSLVVGGYLICDGSTGKSLTFAIHHPPNLDKKQPQTNDISGNTSLAKSVPQRQPQPFVSDDTVKRSDIPTTTDDVHSPLSMPNTTNDTLGEAVMFGGQVKLFGICPYTGVGGYAGTYRKHGLVALGPGVIGETKNRKESEYNVDIYSVLPSNKKQKRGDLVRYGEPFVLMTQTRKCFGKFSAVSKNWGYINLVSKHADNLMLMVFLPLNKTLLGEIIKYGDDFATLAWVGGSNPKTSSPVPINNFKRKTTNLLGGYLVMDGSGKRIGFRIDAAMSKQPALSSNQSSGALVIPGVTTNKKVKLINVKDIAFTTSEKLFMMSGALLVFALLQGNFGWTIASVVFLVVLAVWYFYALPKIRLYKQKVETARINQGNTDPEQSTTRLQLTPRVKSTQLQGNESNVVSAATPSVSLQGDIKHATAPPPTEDGYVLSDAHYERFLRGEKGNEETARARWEKTSAWRIEEGINTMLLNPHKHFDLIKENTVQYYHRRTSTTGCCVYIEQPGKMNLAKLQEYDIGEDELLHHFLYITEYLWTFMDSGPESKVLSILDLNGVGLSDFTGPVMGMVRKVSAVTGMHYPERSYQIFILNPPWGFMTIYKVIKSFMNPDTVAKTHVIGSAKEAKEKLLEFIAPEDLPEIYGGTCVCNEDAGGCMESEDERLMAEYVHKMNVSS